MAAKKKDETAVKTAEEMTADHAVPALENALSTLRSCGGDREVYDYIADRVQWCIDEIQNRMPPQKGTVNDEPKQ